MQPRVDKDSFKLCNKQQWNSGHVTCHQHKTCCIFSKSVAKLLWSAFAQSAQGCRFPYEIIITNLVHSHDWVHGIFLRLNGVWSLSGPRWYSVETELLFRGQQKANIHLGQDGLKEQLRGKKSKRGSHKAAGDIYTKTWWLKELCDVYSLLSFDRRTSPNSLVPKLLLRFYPHVQVLLFSTTECDVDSVYLSDGIRCAVCKPLHVFETWIGKPCQQSVYLTLQRCIMTPHTSVQ